MKLHQQLGIATAIVPFLSIFLFAQEPSAIDRYAPSPVPDRIVLTWSGDPATTQAVTWRTDDSVTEAIAELAVAQDGPRFVSTATVHQAETTPFISDLGNAHYHSVEFTELEPDTKYVYRVGNGELWSEWSQFKTARDEPASFTFVYFGDAQNDIKSHWSRVVRGAYQSAPKASFFLHAGDLVNRANSDAEWGDWFYASGHIHRMTPAIATPGNHEYARAPSGRLLSLHWQPTFAFPKNGPEGLEESVYWIDYQGTKIISLNSNERHEEQTKWLDTVLSQNDSRWVIVTCHHPIFSSKTGRDNPELRAEWQPMFDKHKVDLVLQGHDHTYARSAPMRFENLPIGEVVQSSKGGTIYVVSVSGPKMYDLGRRPFMRRVAEDTQLYQVISVKGDRLTYEARTATGKLYDAFTLRKREGKPNKLIDKVPPVQENRRVTGSVAGP